MIWVLCHLFALEMVLVAPIAFLQGSPINASKTAHVITYHSENTGLLWTSFVRSIELHMLTICFFIVVYCLDTTYWNISYIFCISEQTDVHWS